MSSIARSPQSFSGRGGAPEKLSEAMLRRTWGTASVAPPESVSGRERAPEELSEIMARRTWTALLLLLRSLFQAEAVRQWSYLEPWRTRGVRGM